ncbi:UPF0149 family protein [Caballeronia arationis]|uniref:UPF0149 family protein n=1 Tax=Caballeronia arationis TaxID=1777142 RepID=UPI000789857F
MAQLPDEETDELDLFLKSNATSDETMLLDMPDGYLTAVVIGPRNLQPSEWLLGGWGQRRRTGRNSRPGIRRSISWIQSCGSTTESSGA